MDNVSSTDLYRDHRLHNWLQSAALLIGLTVILATLGWLLAGATGLVWTALLGTAAVLMTPRLSPQVLLRMYGARALAPDDVPQLHRILGVLSARARLLQAPHLYYLPSAVLNAFTLGPRAGAVIVLSDGLLRTLSLRELTAVLAHELSHIRNNDIWVMGLADTVSRLTSLLASTGQLALLVSLPFMVLTGSGLPVLPLLALLAAPSLSALLQLALSRTREHDADLGAVALTGDPLALASALRKLEARQVPWWQRVLLPGRREPEPSILRTHPPTEERVARLLALAAEGRYAPVGLPYAQALPATGFRLPAVSRRPRWHAGGLWY